MTAIAGGKERTTTSTSHGISRSPRVDQTLHCCLICNYYSTSESSRLFFAISETSLHFTTVHFLSTFSTPRDTSQQLYCGHLNFTTAASKALTRPTFLISIASETTGKFTDSADQLVPNPTSKVFQTGK